MHFVYQHDVDCYFTHLQVAKLALHNLSFRISNYKCVADKLLLSFDTSEGPTRQFTNVL